MKNFSFLLFVLLTLNACSPAPQAEEADTEETTEETAEQTTEETMEPEKLLRHVVMFQFKEDADPEQVKKIEEAFAALKDAIPEIHDFEWGTNNSPEGLNEGLTHCFLVTFKSEADRDVYLPHPAHKAFVELLGTVLERPLVLDYWTN